MNGRLTAFLMIASLLTPFARAQQEKPSPVGQTTRSTKESRRSKTDPASGPIDLNTAGDKDLDSLPGVGPATAKKIIEHRPYASVDDLAKAGISSKEIERLKPLVTVSGGGSSKSSTAAKSTPQANTAQADHSNSKTPPPAGSGMVWVNTETKVYHREGDRWYGETKHGPYMSEAEAIRSGYRAAKK